MCFCVKKTAKLYGFQFFFATFAPKTYSFILKIRFLIMEYKAIKYSSKEEALNALNKMRQRKMEWINKTQQEFAELRKTQFVQ